MVDPDDRSSRRSERGEVAVDLRREGRRQWIWWRRGRRQPDFMALEAAGCEFGGGDVTDATTGERCGVMDLQRRGAPQRGGGRKPANLATTIR